MMEIDDRLSMIMHIFNNAPSSRALIMQGIRLQLFIAINDLYERYVSGYEIPLHGWLMFARESSSSPRCYFTNHIQGDSTTVNMHDQVHTLISVVFLRYPCYYLHVQPTYRCKLFILV